MIAPVADQQQRLSAAAEMELARRYFMPFVKLTFPAYEAFPVHHLIAREIQNFVKAVERRESPRLMLFLQPRLGKSELVSRRGPAWILGNHPDWNVGLVSYGADLAEELSADARRVVMDDIYREIFGATGTEDDGVELDSSSKAVNHWRIKGRRGGVRAVGVGGALTGRGFDVLVIDDPIKGRKEADSQSVKDDLWKFWRGTLRTRVEPGGGIILMQTRWAVDDLAGRLLAAEERKPPEKRRWRVVSVPTMCEDPASDPLGRQRGEILQGRFSDDEIDEIREDISEADQGGNRDDREWSAQYQQRPTPESGNIFHPDEQFVFTEPPKDYVGPRYMFADTSYARTRQSDYSAISVWQIEPPAPCADGSVRQTLGLLDMYRKRAEFPDLKADSRRMYVRYGVSTFVIEDYGSGKSLIQEFMRESRMRIKAWRPDSDKIARAHAAADVMATYRIRVPSSPTFPSGLPVQTYLKELREFGGGHATDDMVDCTTMAMILMGTFDVARRHQRRPTEYDFEMAS